jgi:hypothetical protein
MEESDDRCAGRGRSAADVRRGQRLEPGVRSVKPISSTAYYCFESILLLFDPCSSALIRDRSVPCHTVTDPIESSASADPTIAVPSARAWPLLSDLDIGLAFSG